MSVSRLNAILGVSVAYGVAPHDGATDPTSLGRLIDGRDWFDPESWID